MREIVVHHPELWEYDRPSSSPMKTSGKVVRLAGLRGRPLASREERSSREMQCRGCRNWTPEGRFGLGHCGLCRVCGGTRVHLWLRTSRCFEGKWEPLELSTPPLPHIQSEPI